MKHLLHKTLALKALMLVTLLMGAVSSAWADETTGTISFSSSGNDVKISSASVTGDDSAGNEWTITTEGTTSFTSNTAYYQIGSAKKPATSITFTTTLSESVNITAMSAKFGGFSGTAGTVTLKVGDTTVGTGSLDAANDVVVSSSSAAEGTVLTVTITDIAKGMKAYYISYTYEAVGGPSDPSVATTTTISDSGITNTDVYVGTAAGSLTATVTDGENAIDGATVTWSGDNDEVATIDAKTGAVTLVAVGTVTFTATYAGVENEYKGSSDTYELTVTDSTPIPTHTATFSVNGETSEEEFEEGADIEFPEDLADIDGKTFMGWVAEAITGVTDEAPEFVTSAQMGNGDVTYYAVFADVIGELSQNSLELDANTEGLPTSYGSANVFNDYTFGDIAFKIQQMYVTSGKLQWRADGNSNGTGTMYNSESLGKIESIVLTYHTNDMNRNFTIMVGNKANPTTGTAITPSSNDKVYTFNCSSYNCGYFVLTNGTGAGYLEKLVINYSTGSSTISDYCTTVAAVAVERPVIELADNPFLFSTTATITCATDGATIKYSYDGENWSDYSEALTITETKTIYAKAVNGNDESSVAQVTATKNLAEPTVAVSGELTLDLDGETDVEAGTLTAAVTYKEDEVEGAVVTWTSSNTDIAEINETTGAVIIKTTGTVTFTATYAGNSDYAEATGTKIVTVINSKAPGSQAMPYTVAQAIEATPASGTSENVYIHGFVSAFYANDIVSDGTNYRYYISDDGTTTNQLLIYKGKGLEQATFANASDLEIGDEVVIYGGLTTYKSEAEVASGNYLISRIAKPASDLTKTSDITLDYKNGATAVDLTDYFTTSSDGAITYIVADETVIEKAENMISALKVGTTTVTVSQEASLSYKAGEIVINVTVQDTREDATTIPAINISSLTVGDANGTISVVDPVKADDGVTFSFSSSNEDVLLIDGTSYTVGEVGATTVTVTATTSNANLYKNVTATFEVIVGASTKSENTIGVEFDANTTVYGTALEGLAYGSEGFDGTITAESSNPAVATVSVDEEGNVTVTPVAVGTTTITFSATETPNFYAAEDVNEVITITAPEAQTEVVAGDTLFKETFAGNTGSNFSGTQTNNPSEDNEGWSLVKPYGAGDAIKLGTSSISGSATTPAIETTEGTEYTLTFRAAPWSNESSTMNVEVEGGNITGVNDEPMNTNEWNDYTATIVATSSSMTITFTASKNRFFLDDVEVGIPSITATATIASSGYGTLCSQYPLDFTATTDNNSDYKAWYVTSVEGSTVVLEQVTGAIAGGQAVILCGNAGTYNVPTASSTNTLEGNKLFGTLAPTYIGDDEAYGLKNGQFQMINAGTMPAGKAYLPVSAVPSSSEVKSLTLVFNDATGIQRTEVIPATDVVYSLQGIRIQNPTKGGVYIVNGKKVVIK